MHLMFSGLFILVFLIDSLFIANSVGPGWKMCSVACGAVLLMKVSFWDPRDLLMTWTKLVACLCV